MPLFVPAAPILILGQKHTPASKTDADAGESAALYTLDLPAGALGPDDTLRILTRWTVPNSATGKTVRMRFGSTTVHAPSLTSMASQVLQTILSNRGALNSQIGQVTGSNAYGNSSGVLGTFAIDFAAAQTFTITAQWGAAGTGSNSITLESVIVELLRAP